MGKKYTGSFPLKKIIVFISLILSFTILLIISIVLYYNTRGYINEKMDSINTSKMLQTASDIDESFIQINKIAKYMQNNRQLTNVLRNYEASLSTYDRVKFLSNITQFLANIKQYNDIIEGIILITPYDRYESGDMFFSQELYKQLSLDILSSNDNNIAFKYPIYGLHNKGKNIYESKIIENLNSETYYEFNLFDNGTTYGRVYIFIKSSIIQKSKETMEHILLLDNNSNIVYKGSLFNSQKLDHINLSINKDENNNLSYSDKKVKIYYKKLTFNNWSLLYLVDMDSYLEKINKLLKYTAVSFLLSIIISSFFSGFVSGKILNPILKLSSLMKDFRFGNSQSSYFTGSIKKRRISLRNKIFYYLLGTVLIPSLTYVSIFYLQSSIIINNEVSGAFMTLFEGTADNVSAYLNKKLIILQRIIYNPVVQNQVIAKITNSNNDIDDIIEQSIYLGLDKDSFSIYDINGFLLTSNKFRQKKYLNESISNFQNTAAKKMTWSITNDELNRPVITLGTSITSIKDSRNLENIGYASIEIDWTYISELILELKSENNDVFLVDGTGSVVLNTQSGTFFDRESLSFFNNSGSKTVINSSGKHILFYRKLGSSPWFLVSRYNWPAIAQQSSFIFTSNIYLFIIIILTTIMLSYFISGKLISPLNSLNILFSKFNISRLDKRAPENYFTDEIGILYSSYNKMVQRIEDLIDELMVSNTIRNELEIEKKSAELSALQAQINPHFLYNTLDTIIYMVKEDLKDNAVDMIKALSNLFRYGISRGEIEISIREELEYARAYTNIMSYRYKNTIEFVWKINEKVLDFKTIKLILQPVIENAIYHGIKRGSGYGIIEIECAESENKVLISVRDTGAGIPANKLKLIREDLQNNETRNRVGIYNVQSRLRLYYGPQYGLSIDSVEGEWTKVIISIPIQKQALEQPLL